MEHVARIGKMRNAYSFFFSENLKEGDHSEDIGLDGKIILKCIVGKKGEKVWTGCVWLRLGTK
jgi:hypothetical protein